MGVCGCVGVCVCVCLLLFFTEGYFFFFLSFFYRRTVFGLGLKICNVIFNRRFKGGTCFWFGLMYVRFLFYGIPFFLYSSTDEYLFYLSK